MAANQLSPPETLPKPDLSLSIQTSFFSQFLRRSRRCTTRRGGGSSPSWGPTRSATRPSSPARPPEVRAFDRGRTPLVHAHDLRKALARSLLFLLFLICSEGPCLIMFCRQFSHLCTHRDTMFYADTKEKFCVRRMLFVDAACEHDSTLWTLRKMLLAFR